MNDVLRDLTGKALAPDGPLMDAGIDSLAAAELSSRLKGLTDVTISSTLIFEQPTPRAIVNHLLERMVVDAAEQTDTTFGHDANDYTEMPTLSQYLSSVNQSAFLVSFGEQGCTLYCSHYRRFPISDCRSLYASRVLYTGANN